MSLRVATLEELSSQSHLRATVGDGMVTDRIRIFVYCLALGLLDRRYHCNHYVRVPRFQS